VEPFNRLFAAVEIGDVEAVRACVAAGDDVRQRDPRPILGAGNTPLHDAANLGHVEVVRVLLEAGADVNARCDFGWTPLLRACNAGNIEAVRTLLENGADPSARNHEGYGPYDRIRGGDEDLLRLLRAGAEQPDCPPSTEKTRRWRYKDS
jgi:ankyrin repeat protein